MARTCHANYLYYIIIMEEFQVKQVAECISPARARELLKGNTNNRRINYRRVNLYAADMRNGDWQSWNPQNNIILNESGTLLDGQHRLLAVIKADKSITFNVVTIDDNVIPVLDRGRSRSTTDTATIAGLDVIYRSTTTIAAVTLLYKIEYGSDCLPSDSQIFNMIGKYERYLQTALSCIRSGSTKPLMNRAASLAAVFCALKCGVSEPTLFRFCTVCNSGFADGASEYAAIVAQKYLVATPSRSYGTRISEFAYIQAAISDFSKGKDRRNVYKHPEPIYYKRLSPLLSGV